VLGAPIPTTLSRLKRWLSIPSLEDNGAAGAPEGELNVLVSAVSAAGRCVG